MGPSGAPRLTAADHAAPQPPTRSTTCPKFHSCNGSRTVWVIRLAVSESTCPVQPAPPIAPLWVAAAATENPTLRPNASSPSGPYIMPAGLANTATDSAGMRQREHDHGPAAAASPRLIVTTPANTPIGTAIASSPSCW